MKYKIIVPEIMVDLGDNTVFEESSSPVKKIVKLHINLEVWFGDDLLTNSSNYIVTERLKKALEESNFTGFYFDNMKVTEDIYFADNYHLNQPLPKFYWMKINGIENKDDLYISDFDLYISNKMLEYLRKNFTVNNLDINPERDEFDDLIDEMIKDSLNK
jgi:hypothetical protein